MLSHRLGITSRLGFLKPSDFGWFEEAKVYIDTIAAINGIF
jgi:hypothetical protein